MLRTTVMIPSMLVPMMGGTDVSMKTTLLNSDVYLLLFFLIGMACSLGSFFDLLLS